MVALSGDTEVSSVENIRRCYEAGKYHTAYAAAQRCGLLEVTRDSDPSHAVLAARILRAAGAPRRARKLILETWRRHRRHPVATVAAMYELAASQPFVALEWTDHVGEPVGGTVEDQSDMLAARSLCFAQLRDFRAADRFWDAARERHTDAWTWTVRAVIDDTRDRLEAALTAVEEARACSPWYRPAIEAASRVLVRSRRPADARALLTESISHLEAASTHLILGVLRRESGDLEGAAAALYRAIALSPAMEKEVHDAIAHTLSQVEYLGGDVDGAARLLQLTRDDRAMALAHRMQTTPGVRRLLPVPHVPQHHQTCAPATLTAIAELWGERVDHTDLAEQICHDGTPAGSERKWADEHGFVTRQLTVTWDAARSLIDAGIPLALTTSFALGAHLQPVAGYDERKRVLLVVEPGAAGVVELDWERLAVSQAPFGPRGLVFVPPARADTVNALQLPDSALYDLHHAIEMALQRNDRAAAQAAHDALAGAAHTGHYLRLHARRALASYDGDSLGTLAWVVGLREHHPTDLFLQIGELSTLQGHASNERRAELARQLIADHFDDPGALEASGRFWLASGDADKARALATRTIKLAPQHAAGYHLAADVAWGEGHRTRATRLYRTASCLADGNEASALSYFVAAQITGSTDDALEHLRHRVTRMRTRSAGPAQTLCDAYRMIGRAAEAMAIIEEAIAVHPNDGTLLVVACELDRVAGNLERATAHLEAARGKVSDLVWRRAWATVCVQRGALEDALRFRKELVDEDPLDIASQHAYVSLLDRTGASDAARAHIEAVCARFPFHIPLAQLCHNVLLGRDHVAVRTHLETFLVRQPRSAWALYELANWHLHDGSLAIARDFVARAADCTDDVASAKVAEAVLDKREGRRDAAMQNLKEAIAIDVDAGSAVSEILELACDGSEARALLDMIGSELARQGSSGTGLSAYSEGLRAALDPLTALARLREVRLARPHQWHAWSAEIDALIGAGRLDDALQLATAASERYGHDARSWHQLAKVERERGNRDAQIAALERSIEVAPRATVFMRDLVDVYIAAEKTDRARELLERAIAEEPLAGSNHGFLAKIAHVKGDDASACKHLERALELEPEYSWAWNRLDEWSGDPNTIFALARATIAASPRAVFPRLLLAERAPDLSTDERVALLDDAIAISPERADLYEAKAIMLAQHEQWDEALAACRPAFWGGAPPTPLLGRAAWVRYVRGEQEEAIDDMLGVIRRTPSFAWGIEQLLGWSHAVRAPLRTAKRLVEAASDNALAWAVLGEAQREANEVDAAEASFTRALAIDGTQQLARLGLFDVLYRDGRYAAAEALLDGLPDDQPYAAARRVQVLAVTKRLDEADAAFSRMLMRGVEDPTPVEEAVAGYTKANARAHVDTVLDRLLASPDVPRAVAHAWWKHGGRFRGIFTRWRQIRNLPPTQAASLAASLHVEDFGSRRDGLGLLLFTVLNYRIARARTDVWASIGACLFNAGHLWRTRWWLRDHERRDGLKPWMLNMLGRAYLASGSVARGITACRRALLLPPDQTTAETRLLCAPVEALSNEDSAARMLSAARRGSWSDEQQFIAALTVAVIEYRRGNRDDAGREQLAVVCADLCKFHRRDMSAICHQIYEYVMTQISRTLGRHGPDWLLKMRSFKGY